MTRPWTVQAGYAAWYANAVTVEADTLDEALEKAIEAANEDSAGWKVLDHCGDTFVQAVSEGAGVDPWGEGSLPVPDRFAEGGEPPLVTVRIGPDGRPGARVEGGRARVRILDA